MKEHKQLKQGTIKYLIYATIILLFINFIFLFLPFVEIYIPSSYKTILGHTIYEGWHIESEAMINNALLFILIGIPYIFSIIAILNSLKEKTYKNTFLKIMNNNIEKPIKLTWLKFGAIVNVICVLGIYLDYSNQIATYSEHGAYCHMTVWGIMNILLALIFTICLFVLSNKIKTMINIHNGVKTETTEEQQVTKKEN